MSTLATRPRSAYLIQGPGDRFQQDSQEQEVKSMTSRKRSRAILIVGSLCLLAWSSARAQTAAVLTFPTNGQTGVATNVTFTWNNVTGATYNLNVGTAAGAADVFSSGTLSGTSVSVSNLVGLTTYFVTLSTTTSQGTASSASSFTTMPVWATIIYPATGQTGVPPTNPTFSWTPVSDAQVYYLKVGSAPGLQDIFNGGETSATSQVVKNLQGNTLYYLRIATKIAGHWNNYYSDTTFTTSFTPAVLTSPANGQTGVSTNPTLTWNAVNGATYTVQVGTTVGASDVYSSGSISGTSLALSNLVGLTTYYVTLSTVTSQGTASSQSTFTTLPVWATIIYPAPGQTAVTPVGNTFSWTAVSDAQKYYLKIGSAVGLQDIFNGGETTATSQKVPNLQPNTLYYLRIATKIAGHWNNYYSDSTFTTAGGTAFVTFPANGATNVDPYLTLAWTAVSNAQYSFIVGTVPGGSDAYMSGTLSTTSTFVPGLKANTAYYVTLSTTTSGGTTSTSMSFTTGTGIAHLNIPNGATNVDPFAPFTWNAISDAQNYYVKIATQPGVIDVMNSGTLSSTITSILPQGMLGGQTYYVTLSTLKGGTWFSLQTNFTTAVQPMPTNINSYHSTILNLISQVRNMTVGITNTPLSGTLLAQYVAADNRTQAFCTEYAETLEQLLLTNRISARIRHSVFDGTGTESHTFNEYYDLYANQWVLVDSDFGAMYTNTTLEQLSAYVVASNWSAISGVIVYATNYGNQVFTNYYMDPILLFLNPLLPASGSVKLPLANSPAPYFHTNTSSVIGTAGLYVFSFANQTDVLTLTNPTTSVQLTPQNGTIYSVSIILKSGWNITSMPSGAQILTIPRVMF
jgi:hypothetical protein